MTVVEVMWASSLSARSTPGWSPASPGDTRSRRATPAAHSCSISTALPWSEELGDLFRIPAAVLPEIVASDTVCTIGTEIPGTCRLPARCRACRLPRRVVRPRRRAGAEIGDSAKVTYGTGSSVMGLAGRDAVVFGLPSFGLACDGRVAMRRCRRLCGRRQHPCHWSSGQVARRAARPRLPRTWPRPGCRRPGERRRDRPCVRWARRTVVGLAGARADRQP